MKRADRIAIVVLVCTGAFIWMHDLAWLAEAGETLPLLAALPFLVWLVSPWELNDSALAVNRRMFVFSGVLWLLGLALGLGVFLALGWATALWSWFSPRLAADTRDRMRRTLPLAILAFPWLTLDFPSLGWWFQLSTAWSAEHLFQVVGLKVLREGTQLSVGQMPFEVTPACSGIKALQAILIAGTALCFVQLKPARMFWTGVALLPLVAWLANTLRVLLIFVVALSFGPEFAMGWFHTFGGWLVLVGTFGLTWFAMDCLSRRLEPAQLA